MTTSAQLWICLLAMTPLLVSGCGEDGTPSVELTTDSGRALPFDSGPSGRPPTKASKDAGIAAAVEPAPDALEPETESRGDAAVSFAVCGNGTVEGAEECDDGNANVGDGCENCQEAKKSECGNGETESGEQCDDGNLVARDGCNSFCVLERNDGSECGNGELDGTEECDDGNLNPGDGCSTLCQAEPYVGAAACGNGVLDATEECDDGNRVARDGCSTFCRLEARCGNGVREGTEECDDGNLRNGDDCSPTCTFELVAAGCRAPLCTCPDPNTASCCREALPYRLEVIGGPNEPEPEPEPEPEVELVTRDELWSSFSSGCGGSSCHTDGSPVFPSVTEETFDSVPDLGTLSLARILSPSAASAMPLGLGAGNSRPCRDQWHTLGRRLKAWQEAGFAEEVEVAVCPETSGPTGPVTSTSGECAVSAEPYLVGEDAANAQTNLGSCIPTGSAEESCPEGDLLAKDQLFAQAQGFEDLPLRLRDTDLVSLRSEVLTRNRVFSYAPTYTLFSDNAKKQRYVRLPVGQSVNYNPLTQDFDIPDNTRFYKTFLKPVITEDGSTRFRKMETRLIVVRRDEALRGGGFKVKALRATYAWSRDEREALLVQDQRRDGKPWPDRLCSYVDNETVERDPAANPIDTKAISQHCTYMTQEEMDAPESGSIRHYAIPSSDRCDQCHMGSNNRSYILGFTPWHVNGRPKGEGGVWEEIQQDQLSQFERFVRYGLITGIEPNDPRLLLENSQGERQPRNEYELTAQAYMLSNCAYCHNPNGFPVVENSLLEAFNLFPQAAEKGGVFQFPLELTSPRVKLQKAQNVSIPYINPAIGNFGGAEISEKSASLVPTADVIDPSYFEEPRPTYRNEGSGEFEFWAPWRSLIWRNVYTPFTYADDSSAVFVHMPRNVPGFDCNAHQIMADWMLSIPTASLLATGSTEIHPEEEGYLDALAQAEVRRQTYHETPVGQHCPVSTEDNPGFNDDIVDPMVLTSDVDAFGRRIYSSPEDYGVLFSPITRNRELIRPDAVDQGKAPFRDRVPDHAHWVPVDTSDNLDTWVPRRADWKRYLVQGEPPVNAGGGLDEELRINIEAINQVRLSPEWEAFSLDPVPLGLWSSECEARAEAMDAPTVSESLEHLDVMNRWLVDKPGAARVHSMGRGEAVFNAICRNCHGKEYDSSSPLAATILELSGGETRVANFRDGFLGPANAPGSFARGEFTFADGNTGATPEEWAARYLLFMGLGGTKATLPPIALRLVGSSPFYGYAASVIADADSAANMLQVAQASCQGVYRDRKVKWDARGGPLVLTADPRSELVEETGHTQFWESLCAYGNVPLIRTLSGTGPTFGQINHDGTYRTEDVAGNSLIPNNSPIGDGSGRVQLGLQPDNTAAWCIDAVSTPTHVESMPQIVQTFAAQGIAEKDIPFCPAELFATNSDGDRLNRLFRNEPFQQAFEAAWLRRGAINAGIAAFYYLDRLSKGLVEPAPEAAGADCALPTDAR